MDAATDKWSKVKLLFDAALETDPALRTSFLAKNCPDDDLSVRVYEKVKQGIWSYNGVFHLVDAREEHDGKRNVFRFKLVAVEGEEDFSIPPPTIAQRRRVIPTAVKIQVWNRDGGKCVICGASDELHFDHDLPFSKGGTSITAENVQLLCARHNLQKRDHII